MLIIYMLFSTKKIAMTYSYRKMYENRMASIADKLQSGPKFYVSTTDIYWAFDYKTCNVWKQSSIVMHL
jgi:hypothetical protein